MPTMYRCFVMAEDELRQHPAVVQALEADGTPAVWRDDMGDTEQHYEIPCIAGLQEALQASFPDVDFKQVDVLVVEMKATPPQYPFSIPSHVALVGAESADDYTNAPKCNHCGEQVMTLYRTRNTGGEEALVCGECLAQMLGYSD